MVNEKPESTARYAYETVMEIASSIPMMLIALLYIAIVGPFKLVKLAYERTKKK